MKPYAILLAGIPAIAMIGGCDITALDNYDPPTSSLKGRVVFEGEPVGVRSGGVLLELWQPSYELNTKIPVRVAYDGTFSAALFDGEYEINLLAGNGPWVDDTDRIPVVVSGEATLDIQVTPFYTIRDEVASHDPTGGGPNGTIEATFTVGQIDTSRDIEYVGLYVGKTLLVDRNSSLNIPNSQRERTRDAILTELGSNSPITISVTLPDDIYETQSPARREYVFVRIGVKTVGVAEMLFSPVIQVPI